MQIYDLKSIDSAKMTDNSSISYEKSFQTENFDGSTTLEKGFPKEEERD